jgi:hypothetical protein
LIALLNSVMWTVVTGVPTGSGLSVKVKAISSVTIVPSPTASVIVAADAFDRVTVNVSDGSTAVSPLMVTAISADVDPAPIVSVPEVVR